jgi:hypothetical protein
MPGTACSLSWNVLAGAGSALDHAAGEGRGGLDSFGFSRPKQAFSMAYAEAPPERLLATFRASSEAKFLSARAEPVHLESLAMIPIFHNTFSSGE